MNYFTPVVWAAIFFAGCGVFNKDEEGSGDAQRPTDVSEEDIMLFTMEDQSCSAGSTAPVASASSADVWLWNGTSASRSQKTLSGKSGKEGEYASSGVLGTLRDIYTVSECTVSSGLVSCPNDAQTLDKGSTVKICQTTPSYARESVESVTLTSQYLIAQSRARYATLASAKLGLLDSILVVQPRFVKNVKLSDGTFKRLMSADNAGFGAFDSDDSEYGLFIVFPTSKKQYAESPVHLWEVPFVMAHEYGHNVFYRHVGKAATSAGVRVHATGGIDHILSKTRVKVSQPKSNFLLPEFDVTETWTLATDETPAEKALGGANELFADLFSFYSYEGAAGQLKGVTCLDKNRDPLSTTTASGASKSWGLTEQSIFEGKTDPTDVKECTDVGYDGVHDVATALSHPLMTLINGLTPTSSSSARLNILLQWLDGAASYVTSAGSTATLDGYIKPAVTSALAAKTVSQTTVTTLCSVFRTKVAGLPSTSAACQ